jgi:hypothetical protein
VTTSADTAGDGTGDDLIIIDDIDDLPPECKAALTDFLEAIESTVSEIDWATATLDDFDQISTELEDEASAFDDTADECDQFDFATSEESLQAVIDYAEEAAPGTVGWLEFLGRLNIDDTGTDAGGPTTCDEAIAYIEGLVADGVKMSEIPVSELNLVTQAINVIATDCSQDQATEFLDRTDIAEFMS